MVYIKIYRIQGREGLICIKTLNNAKTVFYFLD